MIELAWRAGLDAAAVGEVTALAATAAEVDGTPPLSEQVLLRLRRSGELDAANLVARADGALVGFGHLDVHDPMAGAGGELVVHPGHRRAGLGTRLVEELLERAEAAGGGGGQLRLWAHGDHPGAGAIAARLGFVRARELWQMRRDLLAPLASPELPAGVRLRPFVVGADEAEFLRVNNAAFDWHPEQGGWGPEHVLLREAEPWFDAAGFLLAVDAADRLLGFHWTKVHPAEVHGPLGEVYVLGVDPAARGMRLGSALTLAGLHHLRDQGITQAMLYVEGDNEAAIRLYQDLGFVRSGTDVSYVR